MDDSNPDKAHWWSTSSSVACYLLLVFAPVLCIYWVDLNSDIPSFAVFFLVIFVFAAVMTVLEQIWGRMSEGRLINHTDVASAFFGFFLTGGIGNGVVIVLLAPFSMSIADSLGTALWPYSLPLVMQVIIGLFVSDLAMYPIHRYMHKHDSLWRVHVVHHSVSNLRPMRTFLQHPIEVVLLGVVPAIPLILLGAPPITAILVGAIRVTVGIVDHSSLPMRTGWLDYVIHTPNDHWWHHNLADWGGKNFTTVAIPIDIVFGTFKKPPHQDPVPTTIGIPSPAIDQNVYTHQLAVPFRWNTVQRTGHS